MQAEWFLLTHRSSYLFAWLFIIFLFIFFLSARVANISLIFNVHLYSERMSYSDGDCFDNENANPFEQSLNVTVRTGSTVTLTSTSQSPDAVFINAVKSPQPLNVAAFNGTLKPSNRENSVVVQSPRQKKTETVMLYFKNSICFEIVSKYYLIILMVLSIVESMWQSEWNFIYKQLIYRPSQNNKQY